MRITADTNILIRAASNDDPEQARQANDLLRDADLVALTLPALCEFAWVTRRGYRRPAGDVAAAIRRLIAASQVQADRPAVEAGLAVLEAGGDFADGVIAFEGRRLGGAVFASFDREAIALIAQLGGQTRLLGPTPDG